MQGLVRLRRPSVVAQLWAAVDGDVIVPGDRAYDRARKVRYGLPRRPAAIIRARHAGDVSRTIHVVREHGLELAVRCGGHSPAGHGTTDGGVVLDMASMKGLDIDAEHGTAWAAAGLTAGEYTAAAGIYGLATGFGDTGSVGVGGLTLSGGIGFLVRKHGLTIDSLLAADVVTADGELRRTDAATHPDLFWAIRGGGGNFGVATRFRFRLHRVDEIVGGTLVLPATPETITSFVAVAAAAPDELSTIATVLPTSGHSPLMSVTLVYAGDAEAGRRAIAPLRALAEPVADTVRPVRYRELLPPDDPPRASGVGRSLFLDSLDGGTAAILIARLQDSVAPSAVAQLRVLGGAMARVPGDATAFAHRDARIMVNIAAFYERPDELPDRESWADDVAGTLRRTDAVAVGFLGDEGQARVRAAYPGETWDRLVEAKRRYDPTNLFRLNQNIPPAPAGWEGEPPWREVATSPFHFGRTP
jgi:FAD/FMN-containing dehydrogenase